MELDIKWLGSPSFRLHSLRWWRLLGGLRAFMARGEMRRVIRGLLVLVVLVVPHPKAKVISVEVMLSVQFSQHLRFPVVLQEAIVLMVLTQGKHHTVCFRLIFPSVHH